MRMAEHRQALERLGRSIALRPNFAKAHLHRAFALRVLERPAEAVDLAGSGNGIERLLS
jgi:hypothetical protein